VIRVVGERERGRQRRGRRERGFVLRREEEVEEVGEGERAKERVEVGLGVWVCIVFLSRW